MKGDVDESHSHTTITNTFIIIKHPTVEYIKKSFMQIQLTLPVMVYSPLVRK
jgi:hypothetical protein